MYLIISIDTEEDMPEWRPESVNRVENIQTLPEIQLLFDKYSVKPTYLVNEPVLREKSSCDIINNLNKNSDCEIGLHLHSWNTPPIMKEEAGGKATVLNNYSESIQKEKIHNIHNLFIERLGFKPTSYRAGRYGLTSATIATLIELGYLVDSSVVPKEDFSAYGAPDYRQSLKEPFWFKTESDDKILELPLSVDLVTTIPDKVIDVLLKIPEWTHIKGVMHRLNLARLLWLRPTTNSVNEMKQIANFIVGKTREPVLNMMFHSSELCPGMSPYNKSDNEVKAFISRLEQIVRYIVQDLEATCVTMSEFAQIVNNKEFGSCPEITLPFENDRSNG